MWEVIARLQELEDSEEQRVATIADETDLHPCQIRIAIDFVAERPDDVQARIARNRSMIDASQRAVRHAAATLAKPTEARMGHRAASSPVTSRTAPLSADSAIAA